MLHLQYMKDLYFEYPSIGNLWYDCLLIYGLLDLRLMRNWPWGDEAKRGKHVFLVQFLPPPILEKFIAVDSVTKKFPPLSNAVDLQFKK